MGNRYSHRMQELWAKPIGFLAGAQAIRLADEQIQEAEHKLGLNFPEDYREFLRDFGVFNFPDVVFPLPINTQMPESISLSVFYGIVDDDRRVYDLVSIHEDMRIEIEENPECSTNWIPIADDGGSGIILLSAKGEDIGNIYYLVNLEDTYLIARSFDEFMLSLRNVCEQGLSQEGAAQFWSTWSDDL